MHIIPIFYQFFSYFSYFWPIWPNFWATPIFFNFFSSGNNLSCALPSRILSFFNLLCIFLVKMYIMPIFYQFLPIFLIFDHFDLIFGPLLFFFLFFSIGNNLSCTFYSRIPSFFYFLSIFLGQNAYNTNCIYIQYGRRTPSWILTKITTSQMSTLFHFES